ncbi:MAG: hypothetical protein Fur0010_26930 [Bdellovibrio sp.]
MVSNTRITEIRRELRKRNMGKKRKAQMKNKGTTPKFSIHPDKK